MDNGENKKRRPGRRAYLNDFKLTASGEYVYEGKMHPYEGSIPWKKAMAILWALTVGCVGAGVAAGCFPAAGPMNCAYVILPYGAALAGAVSILWLMVNLTTGGTDLRDYVYKRTVTQGRIRGWVTVALTAAAICCETVYLILNGFGQWMVGTVAFYLCMAVELAGAVCWTVFFQRLKWAE